MNILRLTLIAASIVFMIEGNQAIAATAQGTVDEIQYLGNNRVTIKLNGASCDPAGTYPRFSIYPDYPVGTGYVTVTPDGLDGIVSVALTALATGKTVSIQYMEAGVGNCYVDRIFILKN